MLNASGCMTRMTVLLPLFFGPFSARYGIGGEHGVEVRANRPQREDGALDLRAEIDVAREQVMHGFEDLTGVSSLALQVALNVAEAPAHQEIRAFRQHAQRNFFAIERDDLRVAHADEFA